MSTKKFVVMSMVASLLALPGLAEAQAPPGEWGVDLRGGAMIYDDASALETGGAFTFEALYQITPRFAVGPTIDYVRSQSQGEYFPAVLELGEDSTRVRHVGQTVNALNYGAVVTADVLPASALSLYLSGGGGGYRLFLDAQANEGAVRMDGWMAQLGGGIRYAITEAAGLHLDARDVIYGDFDREMLNPVDERQRCVQNQLDLCGLGDLDLTEAKSTLHNLRVTLGFSYVPGFGQ